MHHIFSHISMTWHMSWQAQGRKKAKERGRKHERVRVLSDLSADTTWKEEQDKKWGVEAEEKSMEANLNKVQGCIQIKIPKWSLFFLMNQWLLILAKVIEFKEKNHMPTILLSGEKLKTFTRTSETSQGWLTFQHLLEVSTSGTRQHQLKIGILVGRTNFSKE